MKNLLITPDEKQLNRTFRNEALKECVEIAKNRGYRVFTFVSSSTYIEQIFIESPQRQRVGSVSEHFGGVKFSTLHVSKRGSGQGSGFGSLIDGEDFNNPEDLDVIFINAPSWAKSESIYKHTSFEDYLNKGLGILKYYEL